jgi:uncharacterized membrane protein YtjA (UPF0391 family)
MLHHAVVFFVVVLIAALFGCTGIAAGAASVTKTLPFAILIFAAIPMTRGLFRK